MSFFCRLPIVVVLLAAGGLSGCGGDAAQLFYVAEEPALGQVLPVKVATVRAPVDDPTLRFTGGRGARTAFADVDVWVPRDRVPGSIKYPSETPDPATEFGITAYDDVADAQEFRRRILKDLKALPSEDQTVFVFVHGFNVPFSAAVYRHAQMAHDFGGDGVPVLFSWPSAGKVQAYLYDADSIHYARDALVQTLKTVTSVGAREVIVLAHSMGTMLTMEAIRQLNIEGDRKTLRSISTLALAAPDIDMDVFRSQMRAIKTRPQRMAVLVAKDDKALRVSERVRGGTSRVGEGENIDELREMDLIVMDLTTLSDSGDKSNHSKFASSPTFIELIQSGAVRPKNLSQDMATVETGVGAVSDLVSSIVYLPARMLGER